MATRRAGLRPVASPVDTFVQPNMPAPDPGFQYGALAASLDPVTKKFFDAEKERGNDADRTRAAVDAEKADLALLSVAAQNTQVTKEVVDAFRQAGVTELNPYYFQQFKLLAGVRFVEQSGYQSSLLSAENLAKLGDPSQPADLEEVIRKERERVLQDMPIQSSAFQQGVLAAMKPIERKLREAVPGERRRQVKFQSEQIIGQKATSTLKELGALLHSKASPELRQRKMDEALGTLRGLVTSSKNFGMDEVNRIVLDAVEAYAQEAGNYDEVYSTIEYLRKQKVVGNAEFGAGKNSAKLTAILDSARLRDRRDDTERRAKWKDQVSELEFESRNWLLSNAQVMAMSPGDRDAWIQAEGYKYLREWSKKTGVPLSQVTGLLERLKAVSNNAAVTRRDDEDVKSQLVIDVHRRAAGSDERMVEAMENKWITASTGQSLLNTWRSRRKESDVDARQAVAQALPLNREQQAVAMQDPNFRAMLYKAIDSSEADVSDAAGEEGFGQARTFEITNKHFAPLIEALSKKVEEGQAQNYLDSQSYKEIEGEIEKRLELQTQPVTKPAFGSASGGPQLDMENAAAFDQLRSRMREIHKETIARVVRENPGKAWPAISEEITTELRATMIEDMRKAMKRPEITSPTELQSRSQRIAEKWKSTKVALELQKAETDKLFKFHDWGWLSGTPFDQVQDYSERAVMQMINMAGKRSPDIQDYAKLGDALEAIDQTTFSHGGQQGRVTNTYWGSRKSLSAQVLGLTSDVDKVRRSRLNQLRGPFEYIVNNKTHETRPKTTREALDRLRGMIMVSGLTEDEVIDGITREGVPIAMVFGADWSEQLAHNVMPIAVQTPGDVERLQKRVNEKEERAMLLMERLGIDVDEKIQFAATSNDAGQQGGKVEATSNDAGQRGGKVKAEPTAGRLFFGHMGRVTTDRLNAAIYMKAGDEKAAKAMLRRYSR